MESKGGTRESLPEDEDTSASGSLAPDTIWQAQQGFTGAHDNGQVQMPELTTELSSHSVNELTKAFRVTVVNAQSSFEGATDRTLAQGSRKEHRHAVSEKVSAEAAQIIQATADKKKEQQHLRIFRWIAMSMSLVLVCVGIGVFLAAATQNGPWQGTIGSVIMACFGLAGTIIAALLSHTSAT